MTTRRDHKTNPANDLPDVFHPEIQNWFQSRFGTPTDIQIRSWPKIASGDHLLISAPTGSGKTLTAFLWSINQLLTGDWPIGGTQVLYVSPLKALNNDIQKNLIQPLQELKAHFASLSLPVPNVRVLTRSGDTPASERQRMIRKPPEILITTPESLNLLLSSRHAAPTLRQIKTVILDEIHALVPSKRGVFLMSAIERLALIAGEFQRLALSATVTPMEAVARFVGGYQTRGDLQSPDYHPRTVSTVRSRTRKAYELTTRFPDEAVQSAPAETVWTPVAKECKQRIAQNRSTLIFTNNRALCEKLTLLINAGEPELIAYAHHGSLSREIRLDVEQRLKQGQLKAIVATNSLELGIDVGDLDEVLLIQCPSSVASTLQRLGRAGHRIGQVSKGCLITIHPRDFLESAAMLEAVKDRAIEPCHPIATPLDLLPQIIVSMLATGTWTRSTLFNAIRTCANYHPLKVGQFDLVLDMMLGRYATSRIPELRPLIGLHAKSGDLSLRQGTLQRLYLNTGVIPNRGYYHLRHSESQARIGELDEEYVWEAAVGQTLTLGTQHWKIDRITHNDVFVSPANPKAPGVPFWRADDLNRSSHLSERIADYLEQANEWTRTKDFAQRLKKDHELDTNTSEALAEHLAAQAKHTEADLPHRHHLLIEITSTGPGSVPGNQVILHTLWGGRVNRPYALALGAAWEKRFGQPIEIHPSNDCLGLVLPQAIDGETLINLVTPDNVEALLRRALESSGFFAARFRECAGRALLITKRKFNERLPLWMNRLRSQKLFDAVSQFPDFPITLETWRTCLHDEFELSHLVARLTELQTGELTWSQTHTHQPSPMARSVAWRQVNDYMYRPDTASGKASGPTLAASLIQDLLKDEASRPRIPQGLIEEFEQKRRRLAKGYAPDSAQELREWLKQRVLLTEDEWKSLLSAMTRDHEIDPEGVIAEIAPDLRRCPVSHPDSHLTPKALYFNEETLSALRQQFWSDSVPPLESPTRDGAWQHSPSPKENNASRKADEGTHPDALLLEWMQYNGPLTVGELSRQSGQEPQALTTSLERLVIDEQLIAGPLREGERERQYCLPEVLEILLRMKRRAASPSFEARPGTHLQWFLAAHQGLNKPTQPDEAALNEHLNPLLFYPASASLWESEILPARIKNYTTRELDLQLQELPLIWFGSGKEQIQWSYADEIDLRGTRTDNCETPTYETSNAVDLLPDPNGKYDFEHLKALHKRIPSELWQQLWQGVWSGTLGNDRFQTLRRAIQNRFKLATPSLPTRSRHRARGQAQRVVSSEGNWYHLPTQAEAVQAGIEEEEAKKERVRILVDRYGILFREILTRETPDFSWRTLFRTIRLMEFSGELISGYFFTDIPGPQFTNAKSFRMMKQAPSERDVYWLCAADPISICGLVPPPLRPRYPKRLASHHLVFEGPELLIVSEGYAKKLIFNRPPEDASLPLALEFMHHLLNRSFQPQQRLTIERINDKSAVQSAYLPLLRTQFDVVTEPDRIALYRTMPS